MAKQGRIGGPLRAVVVGAVDSTAIAVEEIADAEGWELAMVVTLPAELSARHSDFFDLEPLAKKAGAEFVTAGNSNDPAIIDRVRSAMPDYIFVIGWSQICKPAFLEICSDRVIGYHPAPIPRLRGRAVIPWTILLEEPITASTLFWVDESTDSGPILAQDFFHVSKQETAAGLYAGHMGKLRQMLRRVLPELAAGTETRIEQDEHHATYAARRTATDGLIDWSMEDAEIDRLIRAVGKPYPGAYSFAGGNRLTVWKATCVPGGERHHAIAGQIVEIEGGRLTVKTGSGLLRLDEWEFEGPRGPALHGILGE